MFTSRTAERVPQLGCGTSADPAAEQPEPEHRSHGRRLAKRRPLAAPLGQLVGTPSATGGACAGLSERACHGNAGSPVTWKNTVRHAGERPDRSGQFRTALLAAMGNILKIVGGCPINEERRLNSRDHHSTSAMWAREEEGRQA
jgi:hypothetical protein